MLLLLLVVVAVAVVKRTSVIGLCSGVYLELLDARQVLLLPRSLRRLLVVLEVGGGVVHQI